MTKLPASTEPFYYGVRRKVSADVHGQPLYDESPLRREDFLDPTPDDIFELGPNHDRDVSRLNRMIQNHHRYNQLMHIFATTKIRWMDSSILQPRADIVIAKTDSPKTLPEHQFDEDKWGAPPLAIIEVVSPRFVEADLIDKVDIYAQGKVQEYIIIDSGLREDVGKVAYVVTGYRLNNGYFDKIAPNADGSIHSTVNRLDIGPSNDGSDIVVIDSLSRNPVTDQDVQQIDRIAQVQGNRRASDISAGLDFLRDKGP